MEKLVNGYTLETPEGTFPLSTDSMVLSGFVKLAPNARVLDLGSGCGTLGVLLCAANPDCCVTGIELSESAHNAALQNIRRNDLSSRLFSINGDIRQVSELVQHGSFHCCISNPPYFSDGPQSKAVPTARREDHCSLEELFCAAAWALRYGGDFYLVHRPERLAEICTLGANVKLEPKRLCLIRHKKGGPVSLILLQLRKGGRPGLLWQEESLHHPDGTPTQFYKELYHL